MALIFTLLWFSLVGLAVSRLAGRMNVFLAGAGMNGLLLFVAGVLHVPLVPVLVAIGIASVAIVAVSRFLGSSVNRFSAYRVLPRNRATEDPFPSIVLALAALCLLIVTAILPLADFDGRVFWLLKAKAIAHERQVDGPFFHGQTAFSPRNEYPLLVPLDAATVMVAVRDLDERHVRWLFTLFAVALAWEVRRSVGGWYGALLLVLPQIAVNPEGSALTAYCDIALAAFVACAVFELAKDHPDPLRLGLWIAFASITKNEGLPFALVLLAITFVVLRSRAWVATVPVGVAMTTLFVWRDRIDPTDETVFSLWTLPDRLDRVPDAVLLVGRHALAWRDWGLFWVVVGAAVAFLAWRGRSRPLLVGAGTISAMLGVYLVMYVVSNWPMEDLVNSSAPRLLTHFAGPAMLLLGSTHANHAND